MLFKKHFTVCFKKLQIYIYIYIIDQVSLFLLLLININTLNIIIIIYLINYFNELQNKSFKKRDWLGNITILRIIYQNISLSYFIISKSI